LVNGSGCKAVAVACDVTDEQQAHDLLKRGRDEFGHAYPEFAGFVVGVDNETKRDRSVPVKGW
jgi:NAD(P)-dependent dehydrogenase (short-subunit alcohol dehydrogenase family)